MAYVGTPIDTTNQFQSLQGKRFSGDGSTTAFTLDIAPSSVFDIEVFVENVRQDPNSAYALSGTTMTFTGAPASGTNNIYVIHQAKAVGTIDLPEGALVDLNGGSDKLVLDADGDTTISADTDDQIDLKAGGTDTMHVVNGDVRVGTPTSFGPMDNGLKVKGDVSIGDFTADSGSATLAFIKSRNTTVGSQTIVNNGDEVGAISFRADDGDDSNYNNNVARIAVGIDAAPGTNDTPGLIKFETTADGARTTTERMRIDSSGNINLSSNIINIDVSTNSSIGVGIGSNGVVHCATADGVTNYVAQKISGSGTETAFVCIFGTSNVGSIQYTSSSTSFNTSSDYRLKENVDYTFDATSRLKQLKPARFNFKADANTTVDGFLAHEVSSIVPEAIIGEKDGVDEEGNPSYQGIDQSKLVPLLVKTIQELEARIKTLEDA